MITKQHDNKWNNTVCIWNTFSHAITLSWKTPPMLFLSINWIIMPLVLKAWFKLLLGIYAVDVRGGTYFISAYCTCWSLMNLQLLVFDNWRWVWWYLITLDTLMLASKKFQTVKVYQVTLAIFSYFGFPPLQHIQSRVKWDTFKITCIKLAKMVKISADEYFLCVGYVTFNILWFNRVNHIVPGSLPCKHVPLIWITTINK